MIKKHFLSCATLILVSAVFSTAGEPLETKTIDQALARSVVDRVALDVERLRGLEFKTPVPVVVVDDDQAMAQHMQRMEEFGALEDLRWTEVVLKVLGLADPDDDLMALLTAALREQVGGFYDPKSNSFYLLDDMPVALIDILTAHELTHALEDQYYELDALLESGDANDDQLFARGSVTEGSATLLMSIYSVQMAFDQKFTADEISAMANIGQDAMNAMPDALLRQLMAPYILGMSFVQGGNPMAWMSAGFPIEDINRTYESPPQSSEQILHPEKYWDEDKRDDPVPVALGDSGTLLGRGWTRVYDGVLGELNLALLVGADTPDPVDPAATSGSAWTNSAAGGWGGDRFELWTRGKKSVVLLSTVWDSEVDAEEFVAALIRQPAGTRVDGNAVALLYGDVQRKRVDAVLSGMIKSIF